MSDIDELWKRIDEARTRLGLADQAQLKQVEDLNDRLKSLKTGLSRRHAELAQHREERSRLCHENEQLRRMLHRLLLAIEERYGGRLRDILQDLEAQVTSLIALTGAEPTDGEVETAADSDEDDDDDAPGAPNGGPLPEAPAAEIPQSLPDEGDSRWLLEIMERARELTADLRGPRRRDAADGAAAGPAARTAAA
ncbi:MAG: hypothetical protein ACE5GS_03695 [Kiloniellaceae bacterium]